MLLGLTGVTILVDGRRVTSVGATELPSLEHPQLEMSAKGPRTGLRLSDL
jgi:hypothetical protein